MMKCAGGKTESLRLRAKLNRTKISIKTAEMEVCEYLDVWMIIGANLL